MKKLFKVMAVIGALMAFGAAGTDFYLSELRQNLTTDVFVMAVIGIVLMLPLLFAKEGE